MATDAWQVQFTENFQNEVMRLDKAGRADWLERLEALRNGPHVGSNNVKPLKGLSKGFRWRFGDIRVVYRALQESKTILLLRAADRKDVYRSGLPESGRTGGDLDELERMLGRHEDAGIDVEPDREPTGDNDVWDGAEEPEEILLDEFELYLLGLDSAIWPRILGCTTLGDLECAGVPDSAIQQVTDYITAPGNHQVDRLYALGGNDEFQAIARQPLGAFMVALDPVQQAIVDKPMTGGPFLVRGGPGTGKTLVHVARIKRGFEQRQYESLFSGKARIGFVSYNKTLAEGARAMFEWLVPDTRDLQVDFRTLDSIADQVIRTTKWKKWQSCKDDEFKSFVNRSINELKNEVEDRSYIEEVMKRRSLDFIAEEIESVIIDNELDEEEKYFSFSRRGRKVPVQRKERALLWDVYRRVRKIMHEKRKMTFPMKRRAALQLLRWGEGSLKPYDALFVDELQDISVVGIRLLEKAVSSVSCLNLAADTAQSIYLKAPGWSNVSENLRFHKGNSFILRASYRMTREISEAINPLRMVAADEQDDATAPAQCRFRGPRPVWMDRPQAEHAAATAELAWEIIQDMGVNPGQVGVIVHSHKDCDRVLAQMSEADVPAQALDRDHPIDLAASHLHVVTAHSAKGLEFPFVIVPWVVEATYPDQNVLSRCRDQDEREEAYEKARKLLYVALSRGARRLYILTDPEKRSPLLSELDLSLWDHQPRG